MAFDYSKVDVAVDNTVRKLSPQSFVRLRMQGTADDDRDIGPPVITETDLDSTDRFAPARGAAGDIDMPGICL